MKTITTKAELEALHSNESAIIRASGKYPDGGAFTNCYALPVPTDITDTEEHYWRVIVHGRDWLHSLAKEADIQLPAGLIHPRTFDSADVDREAEIALAAAAPHLRAEFIAEVRRAQFEVEARHHFGFGEGGIKCLCGFESVRNRSRTEHITGAVLALLEGGGE